MNVLRHVKISEVTQLYPKSFEYASCARQGIGKNGMKNKVGPKNDMYIDRKTQASPIADIKSDDSDPVENLGRNDISFENVANSTSMHHSTVLVPLSSEN
ncbi:hypothetical protein JTB14_018625 [Gonioctena quinquepunctata]|nr:hypothetical protein JTB14_010270 [Gonioctena quinquepunctata]KAG5860757.1 hypothetical protein JTB14_018625 [Gonioctena quinquepunctata]